LIGICFALNQLNLFIPVVWACEDNGVSNNYSVLLKGHFETFYNAIFGNIVITTLNQK